MMQMGLRNTKCDNCLICTACLLSRAFVIASIFVSVPIVGRMAADFLYMLFCAAFQAQLGAELCVRDERPTVVEMQEPTKYATPPPTPGLTFAMAEQEEQEIKISQRRHRRC
jgi:hypothetical protein